MQEKSLREVKKRLPKGLNCYQLTTCVNGDILKILSFQGIRGVEIIVSRVEYSIKRGGKIARENDYQLIELEF